jgi:hypothetical protein
MEAADLSETLVQLKHTVLDMTICSLVHKHQNFGRNCCPHFHGRMKHILKMEAAG